MASKIRWADTLDDDDVKEIPVGSVTGPDAKGVKTVIEYKKNDKGEIVKVTTRIKTSTIEKRVYKVRVSGRHSEHGRVSLGRHAGRGMQGGVLAHFAAYQTQCHCHCGSVAARQMLLVIRSDLGPIANATDQFTTSLRLHVLQPSSC